MPSERKEMSNKCKQKLIFRCTICGKEVKNRTYHFWRSHYKDYREEIFTYPNVMGDVDNKFFEGVTLSK